MFSYYGSKSKVVKHYPKPEYWQIVEPFAGSARYSLQYWEHDVLLVEKFEKVYSVWEYLQQASEADVRGLPTQEQITDLRETSLSLPERYLIGFCIGGGSARPRNMGGKFNNWDKDRERIAKSLYKIRHWDIRLGDCFELPDMRATWFIDPPYMVQSHGYSHRIKDFEVLARWCRERQGQVMVCENEGNGGWLPFRPLVEAWGIAKKSTEHIWLNEWGDSQTIKQ